MNPAVGLLGLTSWMFQDMINNYLRYYSGDRSHFARDTSRDKRDMDVIRENHQFLWEEEEDAESTW